MKSLAFLLVSMLATHAFADVSSDVAVAIAIAKAKAQSTVKIVDKPKAKAIVYRTKVKRISAPAGFGWVYDDDYDESRESILAHLKRDHDSALRDVLKLVSIDDFSRYDLLSIHSLIHSAEWGRMAPRDLGKWETVCPLDGSPCVQTFVWELP